MKVAKLMTIDEDVFKKVKAQNINVSALVENLLSDWVRRASVVESQKLQEELKIIDEKIERAKENERQLKEKKKAEIESVLSKLKECETWNQFVLTEFTTDEEIMNLTRKLKDLGFKFDFVTIKKVLNG